MADTTLVLLQALAIVIGLLTRQGADGEEDPVALEPLDLLIGESLWHR